jgi:DNA-binding transcriptional ArsR family regulator
MEDNDLMDQDSIFKSLTHSIRREIIKHVGVEKGLTFSAIKKAIDPIDSPSLSYHLKSLAPLISQKEGKYVLSEIGIAAFNLLLKTDQNSQLKKYKKSFIIAYIITVICWISAETIIPIIYYSSLGAWSINFIQGVLIILSVTNFIMIIMLQKKTNPK